MATTRKTKVPVVEIPAPTAWILRNCTGQQLEYLNSIAVSPDFRLMTKIFGDFKHYNVYEVFNSLVKDDHELALLRAAKRGELAGLDAFLYACQAAHLEIKRRREGK